MREQIKITKEKLIKNIAKKTNKSINDTRIFYNELENIIFELLCSTNEKQDICIKLFEGISLEGKYAPEKLKQNNLTGQVSLVEKKIKPKFNITRSYREKLNDK